jgi:hypothetical protein
MFFVAMLDWLHDENNRTIAPRAGSENGLTAACRSLSPSRFPLCWSRAFDDPGLAALLKNNPRSRCVDHCAGFNQRPWHRLSQWL